VEVYLLPLDLARWDQAPGGDLLVVPVWTDVRPLRGAAGLVDWRLNGRLSDCLREERFTGALQDRLLWPTRRIPWAGILAIGQGATRDFDDDRFRRTLETAFAVMRGLGLRTMAAALPGREGNRLGPERAASLFREASQGQDHVEAVTLVDTAPALKVMSEALGLTTAARARAAARAAAAP
jgi:hypothetical protein